MNVIDYLDLWTFSYKHQIVIYSMEQTQTQTSLEGRSPNQNWLELDVGPGQSLLSLFFVVEKSS